jgi:hypothetical protein
MDHLKAASERPPRLLGEFRHHEDGLHQGKGIIKFAVVLLALKEVALEDAAC